MNSIDEVIHWANSEKSVRAVILIGSRASDTSDVLSDYDLSIFSEDDPLYIKDDEWLLKIGKIWVCVHEKICCDNQEFPTRLVIFEGGIKVDFAFFPLSKLQILVNGPSLPPEYDMGYRILLDKDELAAKMPKPLFKRYGSDKPKEKEFLRIVKEFWFEAYHVAVYLKRGDLWSARIRAHGIHDHFLLKMIELNELSKRGWDHMIPPAGKNMKSWVSESTLRDLQGVYTQDVEKALINTLVLFRSLAHETAIKLSFHYPSDVDHQISKFIINLKK